MTTNRRTASVLVAAALVLGACTSGASGTTPDPLDSAAETSVLAPVASDDAPQATVDVEPTTSTSSAVVEPVDPIGLTTLPVEVAEALAAGEITNDGVLAAAVIIVSDGDLEAAIADGIVTEAEADAAISALEAGTLHLYQD